MLSFEDRIIYIDRCQSSLNLAGNPAFCLPFRIPAFLRKRPACLDFVRGKIKFAENRDTIQPHGDILGTEAVRKRTLCATALLSTPSDRIVKTGMET